MNPSMTLVTSVACLALATTGCTSDPSPDPSPERRSALREVACPEEVATAVVGEVECAYLTVPESRSGSSTRQRRQIEIFVAIVNAGEEGASREPVLVTSLGNTPNYGGIAPMAQRVRREVIIVDTRGTANSRPALDCPEIEEPGGFEDGVSSCYKRHVASGIDVSNYNVSEAAQDLEELREELGIDRWNLASYGAGSRLALELLRIAPDYVRALVLDSPETPDVDPRQLAGPETLDAVREVLAACASDTACRAAYPESQGLLGRAIRALERKPARLTLSGLESAVRVRLDPPLLVRFLRQLLSDASKGPFFRPTSVPAALTAVVERQWSALRPELGLALLYGGPSCAGYRPFCLPAHRPFAGVELTVLCRDVAPFAATARNHLPAGFREAFDEGPWHTACDAWRVDPSREAVSKLPEWDGPVLVATGQFDPYTDDQELRRSLAGLTQASYVTDPAFGFNPMPRPCVSAVRNAWLDNPQPFRGNPCAHEGELTWR
jgi:pimeloyl-ACP methyl ester carboxylesterase